MTRPEPLLLVRRVEYGILVPPGERLSSPQPEAVLRTVEGLPAGTFVSFAVYHIGEIECVVASVSVPRTDAPQPADPAALARPLGLGLMFVAPAALVAGQHVLLRTAPGSPTPFDILGPMFLLVILIYGALAFRGSWRTGLVLVFWVHIAACAVLALGGAWAAAAVLVIIDMGVTVLVVHALRTDSGSTGR